MTNFYDKKIDIFVSGKNRQISWASQIWMILANLIDQKKSREILERIIKNENALKPVTPFVYHYALEALLKCRLNKEAKKLLINYWGGMIERGANTFWEVFDDKDPHYSPYGNYLINSYCHSWSSTPAYFFRKYSSVFNL